MERPSLRLDRLFQSLYKEQTKRKGTISFDEWAHSLAIPLEYHLDLSKEALERYWASNVFVHFIEFIAITLLLPLKNMKLLCRKKIIRLREQ